MFSFFKRNSKKNASSIRKVYDLLGFKTNQPDLYMKALRHKSLYDKPTENNERLEYLGDAIIDAAVSKILYDYFPSEKEGFLTKIRSRIVSRNQLNDIAFAMHIDKLLDMQIERDIRETSLCGNALEAIIGAIYIDKGYDFTLRYISDKIINKYIDLDKIAKNNPDPKSRIIEWAQKNKVGVSFRTDSNGDENHRDFICKLLLEGKEISRATGTSKKRAEQQAAAQVVEEITSVDEA